MNILSEITITNIAFFLCGITYGTTLPFVLGKMISNVLPHKIAIYINAIIILIFFYTFTNLLFLYMYIANWVISAIIGLLVGITLSIIYLTNSRRSLFNDENYYQNTLQKYKTLDRISSLVSVAIIIAIMYITIK